MPSERVRRRIEALLDEADAALTARDWQGAAEFSRAVLTMDSDNEDATTYLAAARYAMGETQASRLATRCRSAGASLCGTTDGTGNSAAQQIRARPSAQKAVGPPPYVLAGRWSQLRKAA